MRARKVPAVWAAEVYWNLEVGAAFVGYVVQERVIWSEGAALSFSVTRIRRSCSFCERISR